MKITVTPTLGESLGDARAVAHAVATFTGHRVTIVVGDEETTVDPAPGM